MRIILKIIAGAFCWLACTAFVLLAVCGLFAGLETGCIAMLVLAFFGFPLWAPGYRRVAAGAPVWGEIRFAGFYVQLMTSGHFVQKCRAAGIFPPPAFLYI